MHNYNLDISIENISKIEGHADLDIKIRDGKVEDVNLRVMENQRFYTEAVQGKSIMAVPQLVSRICGTCSIAHLTGCIEAAEKAIGVVPSAQTILLRKLTMYSLMIRDHALHLYFFVLPDLFGIDSVLDLPDDKKELLHEALHVKEAGNNLSKLVAGRAVHAPFEQIGGFINIPDAGQVKKVVEELKSVRKYVINLAEMFLACEWDFKRKTNFVALVTPDFSFLEGEIHTSNGRKIAEADFWNHLQDVVIPYSKATGFEFEGKEYMVGALARINLNKENLHTNTKRDMAKFLELFPSDNVCHNNLAQAIEIVHSIDHSIEILEQTEFKKEGIVKPTKMDGEAVGVIEAPRGTLYYWLKVEKGKVKYANLIIPTAQNLVNMREDIRLMVNKLIDQGEEAIRKEAEILIRAYDPCMSCASHFLKINWV
ncbi:MAG: nickel-dependent hydrogenase large subunit [bacterium]|nr:nickel-dependent hydrogenase large subunit [bacterium]